MTRSRLAFIDLFNAKLTTISCEGAVAGERVRAVHASATIGAREAAALVHVLVAVKPSPTCARTIALIPSDLVIAYAVHAWCAAAFIDLVGAEFARIPCVHSSSLCVRAVALERAQSIHTCGAVSARIRHAFLHLCTQRDVITSSHDAVVAITLVLGAESPSL
jgi:hypothetical protein